MPIYNWNLSKPARRRIFHEHRYFVFVVFVCLFVFFLGRGLGVGDGNKIWVASRKGLR